MTPLEHTDTILAMPSGAFVTATAPVSPLLWAQGGTLTYSPGTRFRVDHCLGDSLYAIEEQSVQTVVFDRQMCLALKAVA